MTLAQLADIYGEGGRLTNWTDLGVEVPGCKDQAIVLVGRQLPGIQATAHVYNEPQGPVEACLDWILGEAGQCILLEMGYAPIEAVSCI